MGSGYFVEVGEDIQSAIDTVAGIGGEVVLSPGTHLIGDGFISLRTNVQLRGAGRGVTVLKKADGATNELIRVQNTGGVESVCDLTLDLNKANTVDAGSNASQMGIYVVATNAVGCPDVTIHGVEVKRGHRYGIRVLATDPVFPVGARISDCYVHDIDRIGLHATRVDRLTVTGNRLADCGRTDDTETIWVSGAGDTIYNHNILIKGNVIIDGGWNGIIVGWANFVTIANNIVRDCVRSGLDGWGINFTAYTEDFAITGNVVHGCGDGGIAVDVRRDASFDVFPTRGTITGNTCAGGKSNHGIFVQSVSAVTVTGNVCVDNDESGISLNNSLNVIATGNHVSDNQAYGISVYGASPGLGGHYMVGNIYRDNVRGAFVDQGAIPSRNFDLDYGQSVLPAAVK